ncbi:PIN domain-containing protein [Sphingomonas sp. PP-CC-3G-468]|uniref:PIN domain-containing protein n=1 Tax=Sphingomonas sp. PP-CC-3G-468 TaxID=2135656 RepID=UPI0014045453|nr:PIN domain-containing protein [Sphingomonas sp. PP-CC-3G-468]
MRRLLETSSYARVLAIDTHVVLETRPLDQLPWSEMGDGPILLVVCRQVQSEIDAKKGDRRLGERSRAFNRLLDPNVETGVPATLRPDGPRVDVAVMRNARIDWETHDDLDRDDADDRIIAQLLNALVDDRSRLELLSHDMRPRDAARANDLAATKLPEHWLRDKAPSPEQGEIARLQRELRIATTDQPAIEIDVEALGDRPWVGSTILPATAEELARIQNRILHDNPEPRIPSRFGPPGMHEDSSLLDRYHEWRDRLVRIDLPAMHEGLTRLFSQQRLRVTVRNAGAISAEGLSLEIRSGNATLHASPFSVRVFGESAPEPEDRFAWLGRLPMTDTVSPRRDEPFTVHRETPASGSVLGWSCRSFRQERSLSIETSVELLVRTGSKVRIEAVVTAANLKGDVRAQVVVEVARRTLRFSEAYDVDHGRIRIPLPYAARRSGDEDPIVFRNDGTTID